MLKGRLAPTPSGYLHLGNALNFVFTADWVRKKNGILALRIDDFDPERSRPEFVQDIFDALEFLEIEIDEGPENAREFFARFSQQLKQKVYLESALGLFRSGKAYACSCSRSERTRFGPSGAYLGHCRERGLEFTPGLTSLRLNCSSVSPDETWLESLSDFVIWTKENWAAYQLVSVCEDTEMQSNCIIRGEDLAPSSEAQKFLANSLGSKFAEQFSKIEFFHHPLFLNSRSEKLSKSLGDLSLREMIRKGYRLNDFRSDYSNFIRTFSF